MKSKLKSRTIRTAAVIAALGVVEVNFQLLQGALGEWYGASYIVIAAVMAYLRTVTSEPVGKN